MQKKLTEAFTSLVETQVGEINVVPAQSPHRIKDNTVPTAELYKSKAKKSLNRMSLTDTRLSKIKERKTGGMKKN